MLNMTSLVVEAVSAHLLERYYRVFGRREPDYGPNIDGAARLALERIAMSDALYHNLEHTVLVTIVGTEIMRGYDLLNGLDRSSWMHVTVALLCHDIGYVRGVCRQDDGVRFVIDEQGNSAEPPRGASDAWLAPYHVDRGKIFIHERADALGIDDPERVARAIELTRFPVPIDSDHQATDTEAALIRAADLIGQLADPNYLRKHNALFQEFVETGAAGDLGIESPADLADCYPSFFWSKIEPYIKDAMTYLQLTQEGKQWIANLYAQVFAVEHNRWRMGPHRGPQPRPTPALSLTSRRA